MWNVEWQPIDHSFSCLIQHNCYEWNFLAILFGSVLHSAFFQPQHISSQFFHKRYIISTHGSQQKKFELVTLSFPSETWLTHDMTQRRREERNILLYKRDGQRAMVPWSDGCSLGLNRLKPPTALGVGTECESVMWKPVNWLSCFRVPIAKIIRVSQTFTFHFMTWPWRRPKAAYLPHDIEQILRCLTCFHFDQGKPHLRSLLYSLPSFNWVPHSALLPVWIASERAASRLPFCDFVDSCPRPPLALILSLVFFLPLLPRAPLCKAHHCRPRGKEVEVQLRAQFWKIWNSEALYIRLKLICSTSS